MAASFSSENRFPNRRWCIINSGDATNVNYDQILENAATTLRHSVDGSKTFVKYNVTEYPVIKGYDDDGNVEYNNNVDSNGRTLYAVRVNRFKTKNRAENIGKDIRSKIGVDYRVLYRPINN